MEIYGKIVPRWVIRSCCTPEDRAGAPPPFHPKCHCHHLLRSCQETAVRTRKFLLPTPHSAPGRPRRSHETGGTIHTSPFSWSCFGRTFPTTRDKRGQSWRDGRHCALLLLSAPFSSTWSLLLPQQIFCRHNGAGSGAGSMPGRSRAGAATPFV